MQIALCYASQVIAADEPWQALVSMLSMFKACIEEATRVLSPYAGCPDCK